MCVNIYNKEVKKIEEIWKDVVGYEGLYQVSNLGRIKSLNRYIKTKNNSILHVNEKILKQTIKYGAGKLPRPQVNLCKNCKNNSLLVSRIVAKAFLPNPDNLPQVNHKDENPSNNNVNNLEWCTEEYNHNYGTRNERQAKSLQKKIIAYDKDTNICIGIFNSIKEAAKILGCDDSCITKVCKGKNKYHKKYIFKYAQ